MPSLRLASLAAAARFACTNAVKVNAEIFQSQAVKDSGPTTQRLQNVGDVLYTLQVKIGGQSVSAIPDTGSFDLLVFSKRCCICGVGTQYDDSKSLTFESSNFTAEQSFGSGATESVEAYERVFVGPLNADRQVFWEVVDADGGFADMSFSGILGVGPPHSAIILAEQEAADMHDQVNSMSLKDSSQYDDILAHYDEVVERTKKQELLLKHTGTRRYSICLGTESGSDGTWIWNDNAAEDNSRVFKKVPVVGDTYWSSRLTDVTLVGAGGQSTIVGCGGKKACSAVIDTGTSLLVMPSAAYDVFASTLDQLVAELDGCSDLSTLPVLNFKIGSQELVLPPEGYVGQVDGELEEELRRAMPHAWKAQQGTKKDCGLLAMTVDEESDEGPVWIMGLPLFRQYYTTFELNGNSVQASAMYFAEADAHCNPTTSENSLTRQESSGVRRGMKVDAKHLRMPRRFGYKQHARGVITGRMANHSVAF